MATRSLQGAATPGRRSRYRLNVFLDTEGGWLAGRPRLPPHVVDGLTCDGALTPVWTTQGHPVNVGRAHRVVPHRAKVLVDDRDRGCRYPGCRSTAFVEVHHLLHWRDGGPTELANLLSLCPNHHDGHHRGEYTITGDPTRPDGLSFETRSGLLIGPARRRAAPGETSGDGVTGGSPASVHTAAGRKQRRSPPRPRLGRRYRAPTGGTLHLPLVDFTPSRTRPRRT